MKQMWMGLIYSSVVEKENSDLHNRLFSETDPNEEMKKHESKRKDICRVRVRNVCCDLTVFESLTFSAELLFHRRSALVPILTTHTRWGYIKTRVTT